MRCGFLFHVNYTGVVVSYEHQSLRTQAGAAQKDDAGNFYQVAKAAMVGGNTFVAQENMARALGAIESYNKRRKRSDEEGKY